MWCAYFCMGAYKHNVALVNQNRSLYSWGAYFVWVFIINTVTCFQACLFFALWFAFSIIYEGGRVAENGGGLGTPIT